MKATLLLMISVLLINMTLGQAIDNTYTFTKDDSINTSFKEASPLIGSFYDGRGHKRRFRKEHVSIETNKLQLTFAEQEILELEAKECKALHARDTAALRNIWLRDFTFDEPHNAVHMDRNPMPSYLSLYRAIERFTFNNDVMYTSGVEYMIRLTIEGKVEEQIKRKFTHVWTKKLFTWKLASKSYE